jgi:hypothetical protein
MGELGLEQADEVDAMLTFGGGGKVTVVIVVIGTSSR